MICIKTTSPDNVVRKLECTKLTGDIRITLTRIISTEEDDDIRVASLKVSKKTFIKKMRKFLEELEA